MHYAMPLWARRARLAVRQWRWSDHRCCFYRVHIWASLSLADSTLISILQKSSIFTLEQIWTFLLSSSSWCLRRTPSTRHLLHLEHLSLEWIPSILIPFVVIKLIHSDINYRVHNPRYHTFYDPNSWEIWRSRPMTSIMPWDRLPRAHMMNIKRYKKKNTQFNVIRPKLGLHPRGENLREFY